MQNVWQDVRYGIRGMRSTAGFTALAMITLGLGIGAGVVLAAGVAACWFPARRATRVDPLIALRFE